MVDTITRILAFQREQAVPLRDAAEKVAAKARKPQHESGKTSVVKRRVARPASDGGD
jgi:hypothetical protein